jgi:hypothetical protein
MRRAQWSPYLAYRCGTKRDPPEDDRQGDKVRRSGVQHVAEQVSEASHSVADRATAITIA